jgi:hypothetical protein
MVRPLAAYRAEHVPPHDPGADVFHRPSGEVIVSIGHSPFLADQFMKHPSLEQPPGQSTAANTKWLLKILIWTRPEAVKRYRKRGSLYFCHMSFSS